MKKLQVNIARIKFSFVENVRRGNPETISLAEFIGIIMPKYKKDVEAYRATKDLDLKSNLPAIIPAGIFKGGQKKENMVMPTGFASFDIDHIGDSLEETRAKVNALPWVIASMASTGGKGLWGLVRFERPGIYQWHYNSLIKEFEKVGIELDASSTDIARKRFTTWDESIYLAREVEVFSEYSADGYVKSKNGQTRDYFHKWESMPPSLKNRMEAYNKTGDVTEILERNGWSYSYSDRQGTRHHYLRPGSSSHASSGNVNEKGAFWCHTSATELRPGMLYRPFDLLCLLEHGGDPRAAALALVKSNFSFTLNH